ncbi:hypothetical protein MAPG_10420 [Magnaporthiopsis poae ATCC 64411]|uniref:Uncharacterized protein n=1 Tax=Magnaporthiopsis poae (strain ATCC 64411 / 73-15) TaxID=644358 RepID=A0A0C4ECJ3_MAGP6|nr:hypothetical protein MAPG_10420 [Magnaporthiopsis poae ATCC 64411]
MPEVNARQSDSRTARDAANDGHDNNNDSDRGNDSDNDNDNNDEKGKLSSPSRSSTLLLPQTAVCPSAGTSLFRLALN